MSQVVFTGFVVIDGEKVLTYEELRVIGFIGPTAEAEYLGGSHGINGMFQVRVTPKQTDLMDDRGLSLALVQTPWFHDHRLAMEPELGLDVIIAEDHGELLDLEYKNGFTRVEYDYTDGGESVNVRGKLSVSAYNSNAPQPQVNLFADIGWNSAIPAMPSPADVLQQLGSQKSLEQQFAEAFASAQPAPQKAPEWTPPAPAPWATQPQMAPAPTPEPVKQPAQSSDDLLTSMFGILIK